MQPIDAADKRPPFKKIANSIRAAILTGEFEPGAQLPPGRELAEFFGVAPMTVQQAIRVLREEGFVTSRMGSGVFVSMQPAGPEPEYREHPLSGVAVFLQLVRAYEEEDSIESRLAHDADKLETLLQAREYEAQGRHNTVQWQESSTAALRTEAAKQLADAILATTPTTWWSAFGRSYTELRKQTRGTRDGRPRIVRSSRRRVAATVAAFWPTLDSP